MVSITTSTKDATAVNQGGSHYTTGASANSRLRISNVITPVKYDRIVTFADCSSNKGDVFACMLRTKTESEKFFYSLKEGQDGIGDAILLEEVYPVDDTLGTTTNVALMKRCSHVLPRWFPQCHSKQHRPSDGIELDATMMVLCSVGMARTSPVRLKTEKGPAVAERQWVGCRMRQVFLPARSSNPCPLRESTRCKRANSMQKIRSLLIDDPNENSKLQYVDHRKREACPWSLYFLQRALDGVLLEAAVLEVRERV
jgi:hypothetical protein